MSESLILLALVAGAWILYKQKKCTKDSGEVSLDNLRMGIANGWYTVMLFAGDNDKYFAIISGKDTNGQDEQTTKEISYATYAALKADGVPEV